MGQFHSSTGRFTSYKSALTCRITFLRVLRQKSYAKEVAEEFCKEFEALKDLNHPNIQPFIGIHPIEPLVLVRDWVSNGNVLEYLEANPEGDRLSLLSDAAEGLQYLHSQSIVHGNLKGANILVKDDGSACLADFGLSTLIQNVGVAPECVGTLRWTAPELLAGETIICKEADMYAFGLVAWEIFTGTTPFADCPPTAIAVQVLSGKRPKRPKHKGFTDGLWELVQECWEGDPSQRPQIPEVVSRLGHASIATQSSSLMKILRMVAWYLDRISSSIGSPVLLVPSNDLHSESSRPLLDDYGIVSYGGSDEHRSLRGTSGLSSTASIEKWAPI